MSSSFIARAHVALRGNRSLVSQHCTLVQSGRTEHLLSHPSLINSRHFFPQTFEWVFVRLVNVSGHTCQDLCSKDLLESHFQTHDSHFSEFSRGIRLNFKREWHRAMGIITPYESPCASKRITGTHTTASRKGESRVCACVCSYTHTGITSLNKKPFSCIMVLIRKYHSWLFQCTQREENIWKSRKKQLIPPLR